MAYVIGFFSAKGGVGKTTMTANVGATMKHEFGYNVLLIDTHVLGADLSSHFGLINPPVHIRDFLSGKLPPEKVIYRDPRTGVDVIPGPLHPQLGIRISFSKLSKAIDSVYDDYDFILLDTPPWLGGETKGIVKAVEEAVVIGTPSVTGVLEAKRTISLLEKNKKQITGVIINFYRGFEYELQPEEIEDFLEGYPLLGIVPEDEKIRRALGYGVPAVIASPNSPGTLAIREAAAAIAGVEFEPKPRGIFARLLHALGLR